MKKIKLLVALLLILAVNKQLFAQGDAAELVKAGAADATTLTQAYLNPLFKGIGYGMNSAWFNSAKTKSLGRFDLRIQASGALVPSSDKTFDVNALSLTNVEVVPGQSSLSPTAFGTDQSGPQVQLKSDNTVKFNLPSGSGINIVPSPQVQLTVGLIKDSEISLRYTPSVDINDFGKIGSWGVGIKKEITSLLPWKTEKVIPIDLAIALGYNQINYDYDLDIDDQVGNYNPGEDLNQKIEGKFSGFTVDAIVSKKLAVFTPFLSVGYNTAKTELNVLGTYKTDGNPDLTDPVKIKQTDISGVRANVGFGLHLAFFRLYGAYSIGEYQAVTAGIGFGIGK